MVKLLKQTFPDAQNFGATRSYWARAAQEEKKSCKRQQWSKDATTETGVGALDNGTSEENSSCVVAGRSCQKTEQRRLDRLAYDSADEFVRRKMDAQQFGDRLVELGQLQALEQDLRSGGVSIVSGHN